MAKKRFVPTQGELRARQKPGSFDELYDGAHERQDFLTDTVINACIRITAEEIAKNFSRKDGSFDSRTILPVLGQIFSALEQKGLLNDQITWRSFTSFCLFEFQSNPQLKAADLAYALMDPRESSGVSFLKTAQDLVGEEELKQYETGRTRFVAAMDGFIEELEKARKALIEEKGEEFLKDSPAGELEQFDDYVSAVERYRNSRFAPWPRRPEIVKQYCPAEPPEERMSPGEHSLPADVKIEKANALCSGYAVIHSAGIKDPKSTLRKMIDKLITEIGGDTTSFDIMDDEQRKQMLRAEDLTDVGDILRLMVEFENPRIARKIVTALAEEEPFVGEEEQISVYASHPLFSMSNGGYLRVRTNVSLPHGTDPERGYTGEVQLVSHDQLEAYRNFHDCYETIRMLPEKKGAVDAISPGRAEIIMQRYNAHMERVLAVETGSPMHAIKQLLEELPMTVEYKTQEAFFDPEDSRRTKELIVERILEIRNLNRAAHAYAAAHASEEMRAVYVTMAGHANAAATQNEHKIPDIFIDLVRNGLGGQEPLSDKSMETAQKLIRGPFPPQAAKQR